MRFAPAVMPALNSVTPPPLLPAPTRPVESVAKTREYFRRPQVPKSVACSFQTPFPFLPINSASGPDGLKLPVNGAEDPVSESTTGPALESSSTVWQKFWPPLPSTFIRLATGTTVPSGATRFMTRSPTQV